MVYWRERLFSMLKVGCSIPLSCFSLSLSLSLSLVLSSIHFVYFLLFVFLWFIYSIYRTTYLRQIIFLARYTTK